MPYAPPIAIMSFNRPDYLEQILASMTKQINCAYREREVFLFQDGGVNSHSGIRKTSEAIIDTCTAVFKRYFPYGTVMHARENLGVALNFERAERLFFEDMKARTAYFFEDDLLLGPRYFETMAILADFALSSSNIGYYACYGNHLLSLEEQYGVAGELGPLGHNWGFGLTRDQWLKSKYIVDRFLDIVRCCDYQMRPQEAIVSFLRSLGSGAPGTSQDVVKSIACHLTRGIKINTEVVHGRYIGESGVHFTPEIFAAQRYAGTQMFDGQQVFEVSRNSRSLQRLTAIEKDLANEQSKSIPV